jgi:hypothetical protein
VVETLYLAAAEVALAGAAVPSRKPFLKRRESVLRWRVRPVPVVFLLLAFSLQLTAGKGGKNHRR